ncbi:hypothetical protein FNV43_RR22429 [Rhamnella rubrinervis]|uniref:GH16 domain-containing protein n=1 Tax=Rhamnella rubrinervis TaxID=2594499 RepID=A0A8K0GN58_9ROSA|nr:hypothetical protein FNV43_RR22429 [Rhamnella rubrinervis]
MASLMCTLVCLSFLFSASGVNGAAPRKPIDVPFGRNYAPTWPFNHIKYYNGGSEIQLFSDKYTETGFQSKGSYLFGHFSMQIKMVAGDSARTVTLCIDLEFSGNRKGQPYILQKNVYTGGRGDREQRIYLWFDPTAAYHTYSVLWNSYQIVFLVDDVPIRVFKNSEDLGVRFPIQPTHEDILQPLECGRLGHKVWSGEDRLVKSTIRGLQQSLPHRWLRSLCEPKLLSVSGIQMVEPEGAPGP